MLNAAGGALLDRYGPEGNQAKIQEATAYLDSALKAHPRYKNALLLRANAALYSADYQQAVQRYESLLADNPDFDEARANLGVAYRQLGKQKGEIEGNISQAILWLQKSLEIDPNSAETHRLLGVAFGIGQDYQKSIEHFERSLIMDSQNAETMYSLGLSYMNLGKNDKAQEYFEKAKTLKPELFEGR